MPCNDLERCPLLARVSDDDDDNDEDKENENARYAYAALGGVVPFTADDMKNGDTWKYRSDLRSLRYSPVASHVCSYLCFTATVSTSSLQREDVPSCLTLHRLLLFAPHSR